MSKKVSTKIWNLVNNVNPGISKNITWDEAWEILAEWGGFEGGVNTRVNGTTLMDIWIGDTKINTITIKDGWNEKEMDWNWDQVYSQTLDYIFDEGLIKKPRARRKDAKTQTVRKAVINSSKTAQIARETEKMNNTIAVAEQVRKNKEFEKEWYSEKNLMDLKKRLNNLTVKRSTWNKAGKDVSEIEVMIEDFRNKIKDIKNHGTV